MADYFFQQRHKPDLGGNATFEYIMLLRQLIINMLFCH